MPSVHFSMWFAHHVNQLCRDPKTRPDAIAVELGPRTAAECRTWIHELGAGPRQSLELPCMLALSRGNRRVRPEFRERAIALQEQTGMHLRDLPPELLWSLFHFAAESVLMLSPTDSIVEAVRCAVELDVPLLGVDLEEKADAIRRPMIIEDPARAKRNVPSFVAANAGYAEHARDARVDDRRELAMAARLETALSTYSKVLFVCGMAHWNRIAELLEARSIRPASLDDRALPKGVEYNRSVVHPSIAVHFIDGFPQFVEHYERMRGPAWRRLSSVGALDFESDKIFEALLEGVYQEYYYLNEASADVSRDAASHGRFEQLLVNLGTLEQRSLPTLPTTVRAAKAVMSRDFTLCLIDKLLEFDWARLDDFPGLPVLVPSMRRTADPLMVQFLDRDGRRSREFHFGHLSGTPPGRIGPWLPWRGAHGSDGDENGESGESSIPPRLADPTGPDPGPGERAARTWPPSDYLMSLMCLRATALSGSGEVVGTSEPFNGGAFKDIDIKNTLRSMIRGEDRIYVESIFDTSSRGEAEDTRFEPIVWLFEPDAEHGQTSVYSASMSSLSSELTVAFDQARYRRLGDSYIAGVFFGDELPLNEDDQKAEIMMKMYYRGIVFFIPPHFNRRQEALMVQEDEFQRVPICRGSRPADIYRTYEQRHGIGFLDSDWSTSLVKLAVPYASRRVTVIAPEGYRVADEAVAEAARSRKEIEIVPLTYFASQTIERLRFNYGVNFYSDGHDFRVREITEVHLGESSDTFRRRLPRRLLPPQDSSLGT